MESADSTYAVAGPPSNYSLDGDHWSRALRPDAALVHDYLLTPRGAERTFEAIAASWRGSPVFTSLFDELGMDGRFGSHRVTTSNLQMLRPKQRTFRMMLPLFPRAIEGLPIGERELVISSSSAFAHGVRPAPGATHVCYCHSPFRYAWHEREYALREAPRATRFGLRATLEQVRRWDVSASRRVTHYIANSQITRRRIADYYGRDAQVIHPPVDVERFGAPQQPDDYLLCVGEVTAHKRVDVAVAAAQLARKRLKVVGEGPDLERLRRQYPDGIEFLGRVSDRALDELYVRAEAVIVPKVEEFGIVAVEAQAAGRPVLAIDEGGTQETVVDGVTGVLVPRGTVEEFAEALLMVDFTTFDAAAIARHARQFSQDRFRREIDEFVGRAVVSDACDSLF
ncbi:MAG: glycosyltransferase [Solirubrobacterales bacterium]